jgi:hypothetical protein
MWQNKSPHLTYQGDDLVSDLKQRYSEISNKCVITYYNSRGSRVHIGLESIRERLFKLSFDAYHCPELRWGATPDSKEGSTCESSAEKNFWYKQEQFLRNQLERRFDVRMDYRAQDLSTPRPGVGVTTSADTDILKYLNTLGDITQQ